MIRDVVNLLGILFTLHYTFASDTNFARCIPGQGSTGVRIDKFYFQIRKDETHGAFLCKARAGLRIRKGERDAAVLGQSICL
jgi:hypothetical protein